MQRLRFAKRKKPILRMVFSSFRQFSPRLSFFPLRFNMTEIVVIVAVAQNGAIGKNNDIPWHIKEDFLHFKEKTKGYPVIMGDKTYDSLPDNSRPLPGRENVVCTLIPDYKAKGATIFHDFNEAIEYVKKKKVEKAFIIDA